MEQLSYKKQMFKITITTELNNRIKTYTLQTFTMSKRQSDNVNGKSA